MQVKAFSLALRQKRWQRLGRETTEPALKAFYSSQQFHFSRHYSEQEFLAVDLETTGLEVARDSILSIGYVPIKRGAVQLSQARHLLVAGPEPVGDSATIHGIRDQDRTHALAPADALRELIGALSGRILILHYAPLDLGMLRKYCQRFFRTDLRTPVVDTMDLEKANLQRRNRPILLGGLRLASCRNRYHLPSYPAHNALADAIATAELFLAIADYRSHGRHLPLHKLIT